MSYGEILVTLEEFLRFVEGEFNEETQNVEKSQSEVVQSNSSVCTSKKCSSYSDERRV